MVPSSLGRTIWDTPYGSGMDNQIRDCGIRYIDAVAIIMIGISAFGALAFLWEKNEEKYFS